MRKTNIFMLVASIITVALLIGILAVGIQADGFDVFSFRGSETTDTAVSRMTGASAGTSGLDAKQETAGNRKNTYEYSYAIDRVNGLDIDWISGSVEIEVIGGISEIQITEQASRALTEDEVLKLSASGGLLQVKWNSEILSLNIIDGYSKKLKIQLPEGFARTITTLQINTSSAQVKASGIIAEKLSIQTASGNVGLLEIKSGETDIHTVSGRVELDGLDGEKLTVNTVSGKIEGRDHSVKTLEAKSTSGSIAMDGSYEEVTATTISGKIKVKDSISPLDAAFSSVSGSIGLNIPENTGFELAYDSLSGRLQSDFGSVTGKSGRMVNGDGSASFRFSTTSGNMEINKG